MTFIEKSIAMKAVPQGLKPIAFSVVLSARLKSCPFKAKLSRIF